MHPRQKIYYVINFALLEKASKILLFAEEALQKNYLVLSFHWTLKPLC